MFESAQTRTPGQVSVNCIDMAAADTLYDFGADSTG